MEKNDDEAVSEEPELENRENVEEPLVGMTFNNIDDIVVYYREYGKQLGFPVRKRTSQKGDEGELKYVTISCGREGKYKNQDGRLRNVFWADARSRAAYKEFGDVVMFDTTYLTNKYDMPFAPFVGVNHHGQSILLGCGLISSEDTDAFIWLFKSWLTCMHEHAPRGIITDQDKAMKNAIEIIFPNTRHRWCLWHIMNKFPSKLNRYKQYEAIMYALQSIVYGSLEKVEFEEGWDEIIEKYELQHNEWLAGLYNERQCWVPCFVKDSFWAGMSTTQRSENMNAFFDDHVNSKTTLKQFVEQYENALKVKVEKEKQEDFKSSSIGFDCGTHYNMEKQAQEVYTISKYKEFHEELIGKMYCDYVSHKVNSAKFEYQISEDFMMEGKKMKSSAIVTCLSLQAYYAVIQYMFFFATTLT
ncbi:hypothetical protein L3X38_019132 [Prunus dulcis]|uniref:MULE transposase domain-containing protein n=1 Tax=Prunus dulcis TaxID=3755 RepID=A0AAD4WC19_PRUDU|nr:hypothetical protein L3X38_019132 [Prunus dulcis]